MPLPSEQDDLAAILSELDQENEPQNSPEPSAEPSAEPSEPLVASAEVVPVVVPSQEPIQVTPNQSGFDLSDVVQRFDSDYAEIKKNLSSDRSKLGKVVDRLIQRMEHNQLDPDELESLVKALEVQADTNGHAVKLLDSRSKLLSAAKAGLQILMQQNAGPGGNSNDLQQLLTQPPKADEDV